MAGKISLSRSSDGQSPNWKTEADLSWDARALYIRFDCQDDCAWSTYVGRKEPLWQQEVVEVFLAPGIENPLEYAEVEVNPRGALFDAWVYNPDSDRTTLEVDLDWSWQGIEWRAGRSRLQNHDWWAELVLPWAGLGITGNPPPLWRANLYRVERPEGHPSTEHDEYTAWSPTLIEPPDFHKPQRFGLLILEDERREAPAFEGSILRIPRKSEAL